MNHLVVEPDADVVKVPRGECEVLDRPEEDLGVNSIDIMNVGHDTGHKTGPSSGPNSLLGHFKFRYVSKHQK